MDRAASEAVSLGCASICVQPDQVAFVASLVDGRIPVCAVIGFPHGALPSRLKADEAAAVVALGASEVDMVIALGPIAEGDVDDARHDVAAVRDAVPNVILKVIIETALWTPPVIRDLSAAVVDAGADFVKTSTGFHPAGGASVEAVETMRDAIGTRALIKASGGLRTLADCLAVLDAGADRLGMSATAAVLAELDH